MADFRYPVYVPLFTSSQRLLILSGSYSILLDIGLLRRAYERGFSRCIGPGFGEPRKGPRISEGPHSCSHWRFILIFSLFIWYFQLKSTILREVSACHWAPKHYCSALQNFSWRSCCYVYICSINQL